MTPILLGRSAYRRRSAREPEIRIINRYFEQNPTNLQDQVALLLRPALKRLIAAVGPGPIRRVYTRTGAFGDDLFVVSGNELHRVHRTGADSYTTTQIAGAVAGTKAPSIVASSQYVFVADGATLQYTNGVAPLAAIATPDGIPMISIDYIAGYIICVRVSSQRFYWINPGGNTIDPLDFAEAERAPDPVVNVIVIGDQFWLFGRETTEVWYPTGVLDAPFQKIQGRLYDRGVWAGTPVKVKDEVILVGTDGVVYSVASGPQPVSTNGIEERVRRAIALQTVEEL
jgi:hypothetical protein